MGFDADHPEAYGDSFAEVYDRWYEGVTDAEATADFVAARSRTDGRPVLELGVGTGRLARPLAARGLAVIGLDASAAMLERCRDRGRPGGLRLIRADMACLPFDCGIGTALIAFNTLFNLPTADRQRQAFASLSSVLVDGGRLIIEALDLTPLAAASGRSAGLRDTVDGVVTVVGTRIDADRQLIEGQHTEIDDRGVVVRPWTLRWATPAQIDELAATTGFELTERFADWQQTPYAGEQHVSVYTRRPRR
ncbi:MAG: class I SAM-dependent methyltransferase [Actinomycetota bacterium]